MKLAIEGLTKVYGALRVVDNVSFTVATGDIVGLIGPNGAGKSTLFSLVTGFLEAAEGQVRLNEKEIGLFSAVERARSGMVRTFQVPREFSYLTVKQNLMAAAPMQSGENLVDLFFRPGRIREEEDTISRNVDALLDFLRLSQVAHTPAVRLSGGQKKLVELGRALMTGAKLVLLDEPFAGVNPVLIEEIAQRIRELNAQGIGFLIIEHDLGALTRLVSTLHVMDRGRLIASGAPIHVLANKLVREAYLGGK
ncbi:ABC transporter ATP-binding protein [Sinorhizobium meliloti]|uniref:ABC transporter ATP-binding protein n=1 Tax=Rhizobium meliloti TaxID=382 RepID=UPI000FD6D7CC|nr:ABC transporter ATP-binding protein [Sinorhizobium meliloti]MDW9682905.1 ATP-binding cassette domain-containing protein [Sinorhizobium meliloti]MDW9694030.1 ATP-binding cassette domain-containing protein [Sinorhizobium meliloti]MDW9718870.1 ATP-binding cassette domain-containing protein [Sinorhizobium meliloti]MDW9756066.1 ATP-binding cassette domain-containing protein [Sinorhizobium meliloti]MDW9985615.1 ATP-binding cassette domain-containing protein [Sinorhizobium meliloti]